MNHHIIKINKMLSKDLAYVAISLRNYFVSIALNLEKTGIVMSNLQKVVRWQLFVKHETVFRCFLKIVSIDCMQSLTC